MKTFDLADAEDFDPEVLLHIYKSKKFEDWLFAGKSLGEILGDYEERIRLAGLKSNDLTDMRLLKLQYNPTLKRLYETAWMEFDNGGSTQQSYVGLYEQGVDHNLKIVGSIDHVNKLIKHTDVDEVEMHCDQSPDSIDITQLGINFI